MTYLNFTEQFFDDDTPESVKKKVRAIVQKANLTPGFTKNRSVNVQMENREWGARLLVGTMLSSGTPVWSAYYMGWTKFPLVLETVIATVKASTPMTIVMDS